MGNVTGNARRGPDLVEGQEHIRISERVEQSAVIKDRNHPASAGGANSKNALSTRMARQVFDIM
jgi:hypothetical protein